MELRRDDIKKDMVGRCWRGCGKIWTVLRGWTGPERMEKASQGGNWSTHCPVSPVYRVAVQTPYSVARWRSG